MSNTDIALEMKDIVKEFPGVKALKGVTFSALKGEVHALVGENGAGKSTLMKVLSGVHPYPSYDGDIFIKGKQCRFATTREAEHAGIAIIHQELNLIPELSVAENIFLGREPLSPPVNFINKKKMLADSEALLKTFNIKIDPRTPVKDLSVGKQQMVEIAKALSINAEVLVLDEPTSALTETEVDYLFDVIRDLKKRGVTMVYISHKLNEVFTICDRITVLRDGETVGGTQETKNLTNDKLVTLMVGRDMTNLYPPREPKIGDVLLSVDGLSVAHPTMPGEKVVDNVSFNSRRGEVLGISGLMGSGRTEMVSSLFGSMKYDAKSITIDGKPIRPKNPLKAIKEGIGLVTEDRKRYGLVLIMSVGENITLACLDKLSKLQFVIKNKETKVIEEQSRELTVKAASSKVQVNTLSGGNQQKVVIAKWLANEPKILILDEPTRGVDVGARFEIYQIMNKLVEKGVSIIMVSSDLPEVLGMSDRILVMHEGKITGEFLKAEATQEKIMACATGTHK